MKKRITLFLIIILIVIILIVIIPIKKEKKNFNTKLTNLGYDKQDIAIINTLSEKSINYILEIDYNDKLIDIVSSENFNEDKLIDYLNVCDKIDNLDDVIFVINNDYYESDIVYDDTTISIMKKDYYIHDNLNRYLNYYNNNKDLELEEIITRINSNLDYEYYTNTKNTDTSKGYLMLVNKYYKLDNNYIPDNLVTIEANYGKTLNIESETYNQFKLMADAARKENLNLYIASPYRSYNTQLNLYNNYVNKDGIKNADTYSARAGFSEHQTGLAIDIIKKGGDLGGFENTDEFKWLSEHAHEYGFILRYPKGKEYITGYMYESWHYRYVGIDVATKIKQLNITFEEYYAYYIEKNI